MAETNTLDADAPVGLAAVPFLLLPFDSITYLFGADLKATSQTLPATALFSIVYLFLRRGRLRSSFEARMLRAPIWALSVYLVVVTIINVLMEANLDLLGVSTGRLSVALLQSLSFSL